MLEPMDLIFIFTQLALLPSLDDVLLIEYDVAVMLYFSSLVCDCEDVACDDDENGGSPLESTSGGVYGVGFVFASCNASAEGGAPT